jgi:hypothetical protein
MRTDWAASEDDAEIIGLGIQLDGGVLPIATVNSEYFQA